MTSVATARRNGGATMFWRGVWGYLPVQAAQAVVAFGSIVAFTRLLSPEQFGHYALAYSTAAICQCVFLTWLEASMARFHVAEMERGDVAGHLATHRRTMLTMIALLAAVATPVLVVLRMDPDLKHAIAMGLAAWSLASLLKLVTERMRAEGEVRAFALLSLCVVLSGFVLGVGFAAAGWGGSAPFAGMGIAIGAALLWASPAEFRRNAGGRVDLARVKTYAAYGYPMALSLILALVLGSTDRYFIAAFHDEAAVGIYHAGFSVGARIPDMMFVWLGMAGGPALVAALERGGPAALRRAAREQSELMVLVGLPAAVGLALVAGPLTQILIGEALQAEAARITPVIAFGSFFAGLTAHYLYNAFTLGRRTGLLFAAMAVPAVLNVVLNLVLVPRFGVAGAAWATTTSFAIGAISAAAFGRGAAALPLPWRALGRCAGAAAVMSLVVLLLPTLGGWAELLLKAAVGAATYVAVLLAVDPAARLRLKAVLHARQPRLSE